MYRTITFVFALFCEIVVPHSCNSDQSNSYTCIADTHHILYRAIQNIVKLDSKYFSLGCIIFIVSKISMMCDCEVNWYILCVGSLFLPGVMKLESTKFRPREVVKHVLQTFAAFLKKELTLEGDVGEDVPMEVRA